MTERLTCYGSATVSLIFPHKSAGFEEAGRQTQHTQMFHRSKPRNDYEYDYDHSLLAPFTAFQVFLLWSPNCTSHLFVALGVLGLYLSCLNNKKITTELSLADL